LCPGDLQFAAETPKFTPLATHRAREHARKLQIANELRFERAFRMKLREFIVTDAIVANLQATDRDGAIRELVTSLAEHGALPKAAIDEVVTALVKREQNGSTGFGKGVAVPHVKHPKVKQMAGTVGRSETGIDFAALDHQPVYSIVLLLSPENQPQQHLQAMNIVFSNLQKDMFRKFLRQSATREAIVDLLDEADQGK
jgi:mannitol/fructose-specific phosphotransferase system IIA component (Ntr-type)